MRRVGTPLLLAGLAMLASVSASQPEGVLEVNVGNVRDDRGKVRVDVCTQETFLKDCRWSGWATARTGTVTVIVRGLPSGVYGVQAYHDANDNGKVDQGFLGIPKEGIGFSNDAKIRLGPPKFADAAFRFDGHGQRIALQLRYFGR